MRTSVLVVMKITFFWDVTVHCPMGTRSNRRFKTQFFQYINLNQHLQLEHTKAGFTHTMPFPCHDPAILQQCHVLCESVHGRQKYPNCWSASGNNLHGTPHGSQKKPNEGRLSTSRLWTANANSHIPCRSHAKLRRDFERALPECHGRGVVGKRRGNNMACVNQTWLHCVIQMGKTQSKPLEEWHGRGTAWYTCISLKSKAYT
jgi:hypothetical protein